MSIFRLFELLVFISLKGVFFVLKYCRRRLPGLYCLKKKVKKMTIFGPKLWVNPFRKKSIFPPFLTSSFYNLQRRFFVLEYRKKHFPGLYWIKKKVRKISIFWLFQLFVFISLKGVFFVLEYCKRHFPGLYCLKKKVEKMAIFGPKPSVNPFGEMSIFPPFLTSSFYSLQRCFFVLEHRKTNFPGLYCLKKKRVGKMTIFRPKPWVNPFGKKAIFPRFSTSSFYNLERRFFVLEYHKDIFLAYIAWKKQLGKFAFRKMSIFPLFELRVFIA